ncbi:uncharacterized protein IL334_001115 [Kwoniella shivajii]|uniref:Cysteine-rich transmembrane CYSTM domain-containing protein n=1 Tax=Kwoniella shivajii TaxID=564305 RepID=A0ABZ1CRA1_9TREE|nr:hypothetical protein IL334_001115 [Kwoniella shivajii]
MSYEPDFPAYLSGNYNKSSSTPSKSAYQQPQMSTQHHSWKSTVDITQPPQVRERPYYSSDWSDLPENRPQLPPRTEFATSHAKRTRISSLNARDTSERSEVQLYDLSGYGQSRHQSSNASITPPAQTTIPARTSALDTSTAGQTEASTSMQYSRPRRHSFEATVAVAAAGTGIADANVQLAMGSDGNDRKEEHASHAIEQAMTTKGPSPNLDNDDCGYCCCCCSDDCTCDPSILLLCCFCCD